jgi:hypothetical protein
LLTLSTPTAYSLLSLGMLPSLPYLLLSSLLPSACHHAPLTSSHGRVAYPIPPPSRLRVFGWLFHDKILNGGHLKPLLCFILQFFCRSICRPEIRKTPPPIHSTPAAHPLHHPSHRCHQLTGDCCVLRSNNSHLRPRTHPPLYFLMHLNLVSQPRKPATARANPPPGACIRLVGSHGTMIWGHGRCCHGDIGQSHWG